MSSYLNFKIKKKETEITFLSYSRNSEIYQEFWETAHANEKSCELTHSIITEVVAALTESRERYEKMVEKERRVRKDLIETYSLALSKMNPTDWSNFMSEVYAKFFEDEPNITEELVGIKCALSVCNVLEDMLCEIEYENDTKIYYNIG